MPKRRTTCSRDCPDACGLIATVEEDRVVALKGDPAHPVTKGFICFRTSRFIEQQTAPHRVTQPLLRKNGRLTPVTLDEALDHAAERLLAIRDESGPAAIFHYRSGGSLGLLKSFADRFFEGFGPVTIKSGDICSGAGETAQLLDFGVSDSNDIFDLLHSRHIFLWGKNPFTSNIHLIPVLKKARAAGAQITLIDPVHHQGASLADRIVQPRPGGDLEIALGIARVLLDTDRLEAPEEFCDHLDRYRDLLQQRTVAEYAAGAGVEESVLHDLADAFASGPTAILVGWGMQRRRHGGAIVRALDALSAVSGNLFREGGGCSFYFGRRAAFDTVHTGAAARFVREPMFGADVVAAQEPPIRAIWITAGNPVCMLPDAAAVATTLEDTEFVVVVDPYLTDTAQRADLVLPVPTLLEDEDLIGSYGHHYLSASKPVLASPPEVCHEVELFQRLAARVGLEDHMAGSLAEWKDRMMIRLREVGVTADALAEGPVKNPFAPQLLFADRKVQTPNGRVQLVTAADLPDDIQSPGAPEAQSFPLWLFSNSTEKSQASQWAGAGLGDHAWVAVHPDAVPGMRAGDLVRVRSAVGTLTAELRLDPAQRTDAAIMPKGGHYDSQQSANALISARPTDIGLGAAYLDCRVAIEAVDL